MSNELSYKQINGYKSHKFIDLFNKRTGRIKRMRKGYSYGNPIGRRTKKFNWSNLLKFDPFHLKRITRWNKH